MNTEYASIQLNELKDSIGYPKGLLNLEDVAVYLSDPACFSLVEEAFFEQLPELLSKNLPANGDLVVCGIWRGGSALYLQAINQWLGYRRPLWLFDTFSGFHREDFTHPKDLDFLRSFSLDQTYHFPRPEAVKALFDNHGLWTDEVRMSEGLLQETMPGSGITTISLLHLDVDFHKPTLDALELCYSRLEQGAIVLVDDYGVPEFGCGEAVDHFRTKHGITAPMHFLNDHMAYWIHHG